MSHARLIILGAACCWAAGGTLGYWIGWHRGWNACHQLFKDLKAHWHKPPHEP